MVFSSGTHGLRLAVFYAYLRQGTILRLIGGGAVFGDVEGGRLYKRDVVCQLVPALGTLKLVKSTVF